MFMESFLLANFSETVDAVYKYFVLSVPPTEFV